MDAQLNNLQLYCAEEFVEDYREGHLTRREILRRVLAITGGVASTATLLLGLGCAPNAPATATAAPTTASLPTAAPTAASASPTSQPTVASATAAPSPSPAASTAAVGSPTAASGATPAARSKLSVAADDPAIGAADVSFPGDGATILGYLARPKNRPSGAEPLPAVLVCHENRGLTEHILDVTRRLGKAGYVALAVDLLSRDGGTAKVDPAQVAANLTANPDQNVADFQAGFTYLQTLPEVKKGATGMIGFCFGGGVTWLSIEQIPGIKAAVPFYGPNPPLPEVSKIQAAVLGIYGGADQRIDAGIPAIEQAMKDNGKVFEKIVYPGANHAFNNDTGASWNPDAAYDAWAKTLDWFKKYLP
ncbi:MAG TPA: dienelactone hydrolase family protein [Chloroflexota bacterium]|nr:dienelactone hydrolase family protein [Chloroflexota bacterium]